MKANDIDLLAGHLLVGLSLFLSGCGQVDNAAGTPELDDIDGYALFVYTIRYSGSSEAVERSGRCDITMITIHPDLKPEEYANESQQYMRTRKELLAEVDDKSTEQIDEANCWKKGALSITTSPLS